MRMSDTVIPRLEGLTPVTSVDGSVMIGNERVLYRKGLLNYGGQTYLVSDAQDFIISPEGKAFGMIVNGVLTTLDKLTPTQRAFVKQKYGV